MRRFLPTVLLILVVGTIALAVPGEPVESLVAVVPEGFWQFIFHTEEGDETWSVFVSRDTVVTTDSLEVAWVDSTTAVIWFIVPSLVCTSYTFRDPPFPGGGVDNGDPEGRATGPRE